MNKALEAFKRIWALFDFKDMQYERSLVIKALTPPTADEVCETLKEYLKRDCYYDEKRKYFGDEDLIIICLMPEDKLYIAYMLPSHIITMIGKFYESLDVEKWTK